VSNSMGEECVILRVSNQANLGDQIQCITVYLHAGLLSPSGIVNGKVQAHYYIRYGVCAVG